MVIKHSEQQVAGVEISLKLLQTFWRNQDVRNVVISVPEIQLYNVIHTPKALSSTGWC